MQETILISLPIDELENVIINCVNSCLKYHVEVKNPQKNEEFLTIKQASEFLNLSVPTLYGYVQRAEIPVCKRKHRLYFSKYDLTHWIKEGKKHLQSDVDELAIKAIKKKGGKNE